MDAIVLALGPVSPLVAGLLVYQWLAGISLASRIARLERDVTAREGKS